MTVRLQETVKLTIHKPRAFEQLSDDEWSNLFTSEVQKREERFAEERKRVPTKVLGRKAVKRQSPYSYPRRAGDRFKMNPRVATKNKWLRIERIRANDAWLSAYRRALELLRLGREALFPQGTYKLARLKLVTLAPV